MDGFLSSANRWHTLIVAAAASVVFWLAQPPCGLRPLAWSVPVAWAYLVKLPTLPGRRPYLMLWLAGMLYWLLAVYWVCLPHPVTSLGWLALAAYLGVYLPLFIGLSRVAVRWCPVNVACAVVWMGLELAQAHLLSGFHMAALSHTQFRWLNLIQIADLGGSYLVSGLIVFVGASITMAIQARTVVPRGIPLAAALVLLASTLIYGSLSQSLATTEPGLHVALIQGSIPMRVVSSADEYRVVREATNREYFTLTESALRERPQTELVIWPETMVTESYVSVDSDVTQIDGQSVTREQIENMVLTQQGKIGSIARRFDRPMLLGIDAWNYTKNGQQRFNSAVLVDRAGRLGVRYDKMHPVMFGEYIPGADWIPGLYQITPLTGGIEWGKSALAAQVANRADERFTLCPSICYESVLSHVIRRQVTQLRAKNLEPDVLVNLTNDGWFHGSAELDMHLVCGVFRAIECRKPFLVAANTGISAVIDGNGQIVARGGKQQSTYVAAEVRRDPRRSLYLAWGDLPAGACLLTCVVLAGLGIRRRS
ncbi:MAG: apolipoprotein N-acyltransferase [Planctomycetaceae bacterium]|nr:apolipoprotein N-acyltransferase [Planctomycetaceae bacterium]